MASAPKFFTYAHQVPLGAGDGLHFMAGKGYYAAPKLGAPTRLGTRAPLTDEQVAQQQVKAAFDPILQQITDQYNQRGTSEGQAITSSTDELAKLMGSYGPTSAAAYDEAAGNEAAINAALAATRQGQGADAQAALAGKLNGIDPGTAARITSGLGSDLQGEATADATKGASNLAMLLSQGAAAADYGAKLPGIAGGIGLNAQEQTQGQITNDLNTQLQSLYAQEPKAVQDALSAIVTNKNQAAQLAFENNLKNLEYGQTVKKNNATINQGNQRITIAEKNAALAAQRAADASARGWASIGIREKAAQQKAAALDNKAKSGGFTPLELTHFKGTAYSIADDSYNGYNVTSGTGTNAVTTAKPGVTYQVAVNRMLRQGVPPSIAQQELNGFYKPGERGRPETAAQRAYVSHIDKIFPVYGG